jgi:hypothetical protein
VAPGARPTLRLDQPVVLAIRDQKVYQSGLAIPLGNLAQVQMEGTVGFDKALDLRVSIPLTSPRLANLPVVGGIAGAVRPTIPIRGTLSEPKIDAQAFGREMGRMGLNIAGQAGLGGLDTLIDRLSRPPDPAEQARRQEEARRRQEEAQRKREERRQRQEAKKRERQIRNGRLPG